MYLGALTLLKTSLAVYLQSSVFTYFYWVSSLKSLWKYSHRKVQWSWSSLKPMQSKINSTIRHRHTHTKTKRLKTWNSKPIHTKKMLSTFLIPIFSKVISQLCSLSKKLAPKHFLCSQFLHPMSNQKQFYIVWEKWAKAMRCILYDNLFIFSNAAQKCK